MVLSSGVLFGYSPMHSPSLHPLLCHLVFIMAVVDWVGAELQSLRPYSEKSVLDHLDGSAETSHPELAGCPGTMDVAQCT